jgi:Protein of unknown function (DUF1761)
MTINYLAVLVAAVGQFIFGAIWYMPIFGKFWGKIHGFNALTKEEQAVMTRKMAPLLVTQFLFTIITTAVFSLLLNAFPADWNIYGLAFFFWIGFIVPTQVSAVLFGGTNPKWFMQKILIMAFGALGCMLIAAFVLSKMM